MQFALRTQKQVLLGTGPGSFEEPVPLLDYSTEKETVVRAIRYSDDGLYLGVVSGKSLTLFTTSDRQQIFSLPGDTILDVHFSESYFQVFSRYAADTKNVQVYSLSDKAPLFAYSSKSQDNWQIKFFSKTQALRVTSNEIQILSPKDNFKIVDKVKLENNIAAYSLSPGAYPNLAVFCKGTKGAPSFVKIFSLSALLSTPTTKSFFKADTIKFRWNNAGTHLLFLTQTDVDSSGKSYYGETTLYLLSNSIDCRVDLDKEGPISDFGWNPDGEKEEFTVVYGYMPAKITTFNKRAVSVKEYGQKPRNMLQYNKQGTLLIIAGFGNLAGEVDIFDTRKNKKVVSFTASNTSYCEWSSCGKFILFATLSPRMRVDNGMKIYHYTGALIDEVEQKELLEATFKPFKGEFSMDSAPAPSSRVKDAKPGVKKEVKSAYVPPHLRGATNSKPGIPGAAAASSTKAAPAKTTTTINPPTSTLTGEEKKRKAIQKKLNAIDQLKARRDGGEKLELTQLDKIKTEAALRKELDELA